MNGHCKLITKDLNQLKALKKEFDSLNTEPFDKDKIAKLLEISDQFTQAYEKITEKYRIAENIFFKELNKEETLDRIVELLNNFHLTNDEKNFDNLTSIFGNLKDNTIELDTAQYQHFSSRFVQIFRDKHDFFINNTEPKDDLDLRREKLYKTFTMMNSVFLNRFCKEDTIIDLTDSNPPIRDYFGCFLERGKIKLKDTGSYLGSGMRGGEITTCTAMDHLGNLMKDGTINVTSHCGDDCGTIGGGEINILGYSGKNLGQFMEGGTINVKNAGEYTGNAMKGGTINIYESVLQGLGMGKIGGTINILKNFTGFNDFYNDGGRINIKDVPDVRLDVRGGTAQIDCDKKVNLRLQRGQVYYAGNNEINIQPQSGTLIAPNASKINLSVPQITTILTNKHCQIQRSMPRRMGEAEIFFYDDKKGQYFAGKKTAIKVDNHGANHLNFINQSSGLHVMDDLSNINIFRSGSPTANMSGGILVLRYTPPPEIGEGMSGGILIIENSSLSYEETQRRLSKNRTGGMIFMRVPNPALKNKKWYQRSSLPKTILKEVVPTE